MKNLTMKDLKNQFVFMNLFYFYIV